MKRGFTLIESIMVIILIGIISFVLVFYIREFFDAWIFVSGQKSIAMSGRSVVYSMVREFKHINQNTSISSFTSKEVAFLNMDNNTITFSQEGSSLLRNGEILLDYLEDPGGLNLTYLDANGSLATLNSDIRVIGVKLTLVKDDNKFVIQSAGGIRNYQ